MNLEKLHFYAISFLALGFTAGFIVSSFHEGKVEPAIKVWALAGAIYIPFYVLRSEQRGHIHIPGQFGGHDFYKVKNVVHFRAAQAFCLLLSIALLAWGVSLFI